MAFVFRSERNLENPKDLNLNQEQSKSNDNTFRKKNYDKILKLKEEEKAKQIIKEKIINNNNNKNNINTNNNTNNNKQFLFTKKPPFSSNSAKTSLIRKEETPGPGAYNINKLYFNRNRQFSSRETFSDSAGYEFFNFPSIRIKNPGNNNPGPGQYNPNEKELFGGKFKKLYNMKANIKKRNISSKSMNDINFERKANNFDMNKIDNMKDYIYVNISKTKVDGYNYNKNNDKSSISCSANANNKNNIKESLYFKSNEYETLKKNKLNKNSSKLSAATLDTQRSSINSSAMTLSNPVSQSPKRLLSQIDNYEKKNNYYVEENKNFMLNTIETEINKIRKLPLFKYDKSKIIKNSQDHERIMSINEEKNNDINFINKKNELLVDQEIFSQTPGPGYYDPIESVNQNYFYKKNFQNMDEKGYSYLKHLKKRSPGPGDYKIDNNSIENTLIAKNNNKLNNNILFDVNIIAKLRLAKERESFERSKKLKSANIFDDSLKIIYENNIKDISEIQNLRYNNKKNNIRKMLFNFGSNSQRFKVPKQKIPPVGQYDISNYKSIEEKNENIIENPSYKELLERMENTKDLLERSPINKEILENPPVGEYNPDIITSIKYNFEFKNNVNNQYINYITKKKGYKKILEKKVLQRVKEMKEKEKHLINLLGPGKYFKMVNKHFNLKNNKNKEQNNRPAFGIAEDKFKSDNKDLSPGPGEYDLDSYYNWITRTYNILFF